MGSLGAAARYAIPALWIVWITGWMLAAIGNKRTQWREPLPAAILNRGPVLIGTAMLLAPQWLPRGLTRRVLTPGHGLPALGTILVFLGLLFAFWARWHLGRNWSGTVTVKQDHTLITSGPYRWVRHPIYSGIVLALLGTALAIGAPYGFVATVLIVLGFLVKLRAEEARMRATFPAAYDDYCRHTARLIPGVF